MIKLDKLEEEIIKYQNIDIFAGKIPINVNKFEQISSYEGFLLTVLFYILMIIFTFLSSPGDIYWRQNPSVSQSYKNQDLTHAVDFTKDFFFYYNIFYVNNTKVDDESYIYTRLRIKTIYNNKQKKPTIEYFDDEVCNENNMRDINNLPEDKLKGSYRCPSFKNYKIEGSSLEEKTQIGQIVVYPCYYNNTKNQRNCKSQSEIENFIYKQKLKIKLMYPVPIVKILNISHPMIYKIKEDYFYLSSSLMDYHYVNYNFDKIELITDDNIFISTSSPKYEYEMKIVSVDKRRIDDDDPRFFSIDLTSSFMLTTYTRVYLKLLDCLSIIGGFHPILFTVFQIVYAFFSEINILQYMMDKIFNINNPLDYTKKKKINFDRNKFDVSDHFNGEIIKRPNGRQKSGQRSFPSRYNMPFIGFDKNKKTLLDRSDYLFGNSIELKNSSNLNNEISNFNNENFLNENSIGINKLNYSGLIEKDKIKNKEDIIDLSENREILTKKFENLDPSSDSAKKENQENSIDKEKDKKDEETNDIKKYYIQVLKNLRMKNNIKLESDFKAYFNWTKCFGYGKNTNSKKYKLNKLIEKIQDKILDYFDYLNVIRCIDELELLKTIIFEKEELPIISALRIPIVDLGEDFDLKKFNIKFANHLEEDIKDEDMETGVEKMILEEKRNKISKKILKHLREMSE